MKTAIRFLFLDIGGVLLTDGWDHHFRKKAAVQFDLDLVELNARHHLMFEQSKPYPKMIHLIARLKDRYGFKVGIVSNEAREINTYRIRKFKLATIADFFISSCFVHLRKPDADIFRLALDIAQASVHEALYLDNTPLFVQVAESLGIRSILHEDYGSTCTKLASLGLELKDEQENAFSRFAA